MHFAVVYFIVLALLAVALGGAVALVGGWEDRSADAWRAKLVFMALAAGGTLLIAWVAWLIALGIMVIIAQASS